jgi:hypothetical protein
MDPNVIYIILAIFGSALAVYAIKPREPRRDNSRIVRKLKK